MFRRYVLAINPGSTSTKVSIYEDEVEVKSKKIIHPKQELDRFINIMDQYEYRLDLIKEWLADIEIELNSLIAIVGRGGLLRPIPGGTYIVSAPMIEDLGKGLQGVHASNLGGILAKCIGDLSGVSSYIVDPVGVDEFHDVARITGLKEIPKVSLIHALNMKAIAHRRVEELGINLDEENFIIAHLGGGISVAPFECGLAIDVNNAIQMGPMSPERTGHLPVGDLVKMCFSGDYTLAQMKYKVQGGGGLMSYLGTTDAEEIVERINNGDEYAKLVFDAMAYQIGKEIGSCSTVLKGNVRNIILTGGLAFSNYLVDKIKDMVSFIGDVIVYPGEDEMSALNNGVLRVLLGEELPKIYEEEVRY